MFATNCTLTGGGFDTARDITAITVNRWPHAWHQGHRAIMELLHSDKA